MAWIAILYFASSITHASAQQDNGIHVRSPKVYDSRELTLMLGNLSQQLQNKNFVDQKALAASLGNIPGYQNSDFSLRAFSNGGVGAEAASVFAGGGAGSATPPGSTGTSNTPTVTINAADLLCTDWAPQLETGFEFPLSDDGLRCANPRTERLSFTGVSLHSMQFKVSAAALSSPGCNPARPLGQVCVLDSSGGEVQWICVPE
jgi:hypothetical protein